jgi:hypothetical protein
VILVGNLDVETTWARMDAAARRARGENAPRPDDPRFALPEPVRRKISAAATLMRVFATSDDDVLWTPRPVDPSRMAKVEWLSTPRLAGGPTPESADVWWGEPTATTAAFAHRSMTARWRDAAKTPNRLAAVVGSLDELTARAGAKPWPWVAKAPYSAAGRSRVRGPGGPLDAPTAAHARRLLDLYGSLLFEPWLFRTGDFGVAGETGLTVADAFTLHEPHVLEVDEHGGFRGIVTSARKREPVAGEKMHPALSVGLRVAQALLGAGYRGWFGADVLQVEGSDGRTRTGLSEVNCRRTFGHVAHALAERRMRHLGERVVAPVVLRFGRGLPPSDTIPLLLPGTDDDTSAWLEVQDLRRD